MCIFHSIIQEQAILFDISTFERNIYAAIMVNNEQSKIYVKDIIGEDYKAWNRDKIFFDCGTGTGKTSFIMDILLMHALKECKRILYLCNRNKLKAQVDRNLLSYCEGDDDISIYTTTMVVMTYQKFERLLVHDETQFDCFSYIVADECHYFFDDSLFNKYTDISFLYLNDRAKSTVIFMSATAKFLKILYNAFGKVLISYEIPRTYEHVENMFLYMPSKVIMLIQELLLRDKHTKIIYFCNSIKLLKKAHKAFGDGAYYLCSEAQVKKDGELNKIINPDCIENTEVENGKITFDKRLLVTTSVIDNGIDIKDRDIRYLILDTKDIGTTIQCVGRKRPIDDNDKYTIFFAQYSLDSFSAEYEEAEKNYELGKMFGKSYEYIKRETIKSRDFLKENPIFYLGHEKATGHLKIRMNVCIYFKSMMRIAHYNSILKRDYEYFLESNFGRIPEYYHVDDIIITFDQHNELQDFLDEHSSMDLYSDKKNALIKMICKITKKPTADIRTVNNILESLGLPYKAIHTRTNKARGWRIV